MEISAFLHFYFYLRLEHIFHLLVEKAREPRDQVVVRVSMAECYNTRGQLRKSVETGIDALRLSGVGIHNKYCYVQL